MEIPFLLGVALLALAVGALVWLRAASTTSLVIETGDLRIRPFADSDGPAVAATIDLPVATANGWTAEIHAAAVRTFESPKNIDLASHFLIESVDTGATLGVITLANEKAQPYAPSIGFWLGPDARGKGIGAKAIPAFIVLLTHAGIDEAFLGTALDNAPMRRIATGAGGIEHDFRPFELPNGDVVDSVWHRFTPTTAALEND